MTTPRPSTNSAPSTTLLETTRCPSSETQLSLLTEQEWARSSGTEAFSYRVCSEVRECLKLDPDHKQCYSHYKQVRKLNKQILSAEELIQEQRWVCAIFIFICLTLTHYIRSIRWRVTVPLAQAYCACEIPTQVELVEMNEGDNFYLSYDFWLYSGSICML